MMCGARADARQVDTLPLSLLEFYRGEIRKFDDEREHFLRKLKEVGVTQEEIHHERREISREQCESLQGHLNERVLRRHLLSVVFLTTALPLSL